MKVPHGSMRPVGLLLLTVLALVTVAGCGGGDTTPPAATPTADGQTPQAEDWQAEWDRIVAAAEEEGTVVVFGPPGDPVRRALTEGFQAAFPGITVEWSGGRGGEQGAIISAERGAGISSVDIMIQGLPSYQQVIQPLNVTQPIMPDLILPEVLDTTKWRNGELQITEDGMDLGFTISTNPEIIYNLDQITDPTEIDEYQDLLDPKWTGKIVMNDPIPSGAGYSTLRNAVKALGSWEAAEEWLRAMRAQAGAVDRDQRRIIEWVAQGRYPIGFRASGGTLGQLSAEGLQVGYVKKLKESVPDYSNSFGTLMRLSDPPHPNAQIVFMNWLLTQEGQTAWSTSMNLGSLRLDVSTDHLPEFSRPEPDVEYSFEWDPLRTEEEEALVQELFGQ